MKLIISRKGFDSASGGVPNPIMPSGEMLMLPIPDPSAPRKYGDIQATEVCMGRLVADLTRGKYGPDSGAHLDPDLWAGSVRRRQGWRPVFGQCGAAQTHLQSHGVGSGDIFLYYGWFRQVEKIGSGYRYVRDAPDIHALFGWLQVEGCVPVYNRTGIPLWALDHAHCTREAAYSNDSVYISSPQLTLPGVRVSKPGAGIFTEYNERFRLSAQGQSRSRWKLPGWFNPGGKRPPLSYHGDPGRWEQRADNTLLRSVGRGQEFVLDCDYYPEAIDWLLDLLR